MSSHRICALLGAGIVFSLVSILPAEPLREARVNKIINEVTVIDPVDGARPAQLDELIKNELGLKTGIKSRSELIFQDETLMRVGPESFFSFKPGTRDMALKEGTMLLQVPKGIGGAKIRTAAVTASITGTTIMLEHRPNKLLKVLVLEGSLRLSVNGTFGDSLLLLPGKMVIMNPNDKRIPEPVAVDLASLVKTSSLVQMPPADENKPVTSQPLPSMPLIDLEIAKQAREKKGSELVDTNLIIRGRGTNVVVAADDIPKAVEAKRKFAPPFVVASNPMPSPSAHPVITPTPPLAPSPQPAASATPSATPLPTASASPSASPTPTASASPSATPTPTASPTPSPTPSASPTATPVPTPFGPPTATGPTPNPVALSTPRPTPTMGAVPPPAPSTTFHTPPVVNAAFTVDNATNIRTVGISPKISQGTLTLTGSIWYGPAQDGPATYFLFGSSSVYDAQRHFDADYSTHDDQAFDPFGPANFRFVALSISGTPSFSTTNGSLFNVSLSSDSTITEPAGVIAYSWTLSPLHSLTFTANGGIALDHATFTATAGSAFKYLQLYERGAGISFGGTVNLPTAGLFLDAPGAINLTRTSSLTVDHAVITSGSTVDLNGSVTANSLQIWSGGTTQLHNAIAAPALLYVYAPALTATGTISALGGVLQIGAGGIDVAQNDLTGFDRVSSDGDIRAGSISATQSIHANGAIIGGTGTYNLSAFSIDTTGGLFYDGNPGAAGGNVTLSADTIYFNNTAGSISGARLDGGDATGAKPTGGNGGSLNIGTDAAPIAGDVVLNSAISATTGTNDPSVQTGGAGGTVTIVSNGTTSLASTVKVSESVGSAKSSSGGNITVKSNKTSGTAINVSNSAQLLSLLNSAAPGSGGTIKFTSAGGAINLGGKVTADRGTIDVANNGAGGVVNVTNANLSASTIKASALGTNGTLNVGGGTISADNLISLYAAGSNGAVNFTDNVTLSGNSVKNIQGNSVTVRDGKVVNVQGSAPANVFTNNPNYSGFGGNGSTTGTFGGTGATTAPLIAGPGPGG